MNRKIVENTKLLCKSARPAMLTMLTAEKDIVTLRKRMETAKTERETIALTRALERREEEKNQAAEIVYSFKSAIDGLEEQERDVLQQLYFKGRKSKEVESLDGRIMDMREVDTIRKRAVRHLSVNAERLQRLKDGMSEIV